MKELKHIKKFMFDHAKYRLEDLEGNNLLLVVDYKNNRYDVVNEPAASVLPTVLEEVATFARDLLARKSGVNFAEKRL